ncbi:hypothetical protein [Streptomyces cinnamoneus]|uniref:Uncharacterized protein n=1 Tax=Streptomyces cinnamoneus TaxID=53446 RepID=A0A918TAD1_STRCJ|nr:hypothetical protein [Streptomyces cinnamoneus]GHC39023.1 hypothetical protein GCM10010507_10870 [Streptomyces cinnamoneus]
MAYGSGTNGSLRSELIDLSGVSLDELREVGGLPGALEALQGRPPRAGQHMESGSARRHQNTGSR